MQPARDVGGVDDRQGPRRPQLPRQPGVRPDPVREVDAVLQRDRASRELRVLGIANGGEHRRPKILYLADRNILIDDPKDKVLRYFERIIQALLCSLYEGAHAVDGSGGDGGR